jgi:hypothetical protein
MATGLNPVEVAKDSRRLATVWEENPEFKMKDLSLENLKQDTGDLEDTVKEIEKLEVKLTPLRNRRDGLMVKLNDINVRGRAGMKSYFGSDSDQYEQVGGTRKSERGKKSAKKDTGSTDKGTTSK